MNPVWVNRVNEGSTLMVLVSSELLVNSPVLHCTGQVEIILFDAPSLSFRKGHADIVKYLCEVHCNIDSTTDGGETPLHIACW